MQTPQDVTRLDRAVSEALVRAGYSRKGATLVAAVSGGPDSTALLNSLHRLSREHQLKLHVAHLIHDTRGEESEQDAAFVQKLAARLELPATVEKQDPLEYQRERNLSSFEQATREMRYLFLLRVAREHNAPAVAVGHTADDQAETVLEHLIRGAGLHGLRGMTEVAPWPYPAGSKDVMVFRPLLTLSKADAVAYCRALGREFRQDSDNYQPRFTRNRVRHELLPLLAADYNPRITDSLVRLSRIAALEVDYLESECDRLWPQVVKLSPESAGDVRFRRRELGALHPALQRLLLRRGYSIIAGDTRRLRESHLSGMAESLNARGASFNLNLPLGIRAHGTPDELVLSRRRVLPCPLPEVKGEHPLKLPEATGDEQVTEVGEWHVTARLVKAETVESRAGDEKFTTLLSSNLAGGVLRVRTRHPGDRFQPLGMSAEKRLQDFFVDSKVPREWRSKVPLVVCPRGIAWVVGYRIAEWAKVTPGCTTALQISFNQ